MKTIQYIVSITQHVFIDNVPGPYRIYNYVYIIIYNYIIKHILADTTLSSCTHIHDLVFHEQHTKAISVDLSK